MKKPLILLSMVIAILCSSLFLWHQTSIMVYALENNQSRLDTVDRLVQEFPSEHQSLLFTHSSKQIHFITDIENSMFDVEPAITETVSEVYVKELDTQYEDLLERRRIEEEKRRKEEEERKRQEELRRQEEARKKAEAERQAAIKAERERQAAIQAEKDRVRAMLNNNELGNAGRLIIPSLNIGLPLNTGKGSTWKYWCDLPNSAVLFPWGTETVIGDHNNQGFVNLGQIKVGAEVYIKTTEGLQKYVVTEKTTGHNIEKDLVTDDGRSVRNLNYYGLCMYTCRDCWQNIWIIFCRKV